MTDMRQQILQSFEGLVQGPLEMLFNLIEKDCLNGAQECVPYMREFLVKHKSYMMDLMAPEKPAQVAAEEAPKPAPKAKPKKKPAPATPAVTVFEEFEETEEAVEEEGEEDHG